MKFNEIALAALALFTLGACADNIERPEPPVQNIKLSDLNKAMHIGETYQMTAEVLPENQKDAPVIWASDNEKVATIDATGLITALTEGNAMITANVDNVTAQCKVSVTPVFVESVTLDRTEMEMSVNDVETLVATVLPDNASDKTVTWSVAADPAGCVTVEGGKVTAHAVGTAVITAKAGDKEANCNVVVLGLDPVMMPPTLEILNGKTGELKVTLPISLRGQTVVWESMDQTKATVAAKDGDSCIGIVTAVGYGKVTIKATVGGKELTSEITIPAKVELNLDDYADAEAFQAAVVGLDAKGVTEYVLKGDIAKLGFTESGKGHNAFSETPDVESIDFSATTGWDKLKTKIVLNSSTPAMPKPGKEFTNGLGKAFNADPNTHLPYGHLRRLVFPSELKVAGRFFVANIPTMEEVIAPGVTHLHKDAFKDLPVLRTVKLTTFDNFVHGVAVGEKPFQGGEAYLPKLKENCTLYLNANKKEQVKDNTFFDVEFKAIVFE